MIASVYSGSMRAPSINGQCHPDFAAVQPLLQKQLAKNAGGAALCVYHRGECVVDIWGGERDKQGNPWQENTMAPSFSTTKGVTSTLLHVFADRGEIDYDAPVARYWPEFAQAGKSRITVRQVLCHQAGLYHIRKMVDRADRMLDWEYMVRAIERIEPAHVPGTRAGYHALSYGFIVGELVQRVSGGNFSKLVQTELARPLELDGLYVGAPKNQLGRAAQLMGRGPGSRLSRRLLGYWVQANVASASQLMKRLGIEGDPYSFYDALAPRGMREIDFNTAETLGVAIPAANGLFTARSLARLYAMLAGRGEVDGVRLLGADTVRHATVLQTHPGKHAVIPFDLRWRLGYHGIYTSRGFLDSAFGHFGVGGSGAWADPDRQLAVAVITNGGVKSPLALSTSVVRAAAARA